MSPRVRKLYTFPIDADLALGLKEVKARDGISEAEQIRRGIQMWLRTKGVIKKAERPRAATRETRLSTSTRVEWLAACRDSTPNPADRWPQSAGRAEGGAIVATTHQRAAIYARVSTFDQEPENQLQELRRYVEARGWTGTEYIDKGVSGAKDSQAGSGHASSGTPSAGSSTPSSSGGSTGSGAT